MASMTYCPSTRKCFYRVEQIVLLITTFLVYATGIRNIVPSHGATNTKEIDTGTTDSVYGFTERLTYHHATPTDNDYQRPITPPSPPINDVGTYNDFRPSQQVLEFTISDATTTLQKYPPSYLNNGLKSPSTVKRGTSTNFLQSPLLPSQPSSIPKQRLAVKRYNNEDAQLPFPTGASSAIEQFDNKFGNRIKENTGSSVSTVLPHVQTTPIISYHDPFTYQNYQASSSLSSSSSELQFEDNDDIIYQGQKGSAAAAHQQREDAPQAYTVKSTLLVGTNPNRGYFNSVSHDFDASFNGNRPLTSPNNEYKRPGYVFDEQIRPNYISDNNKFKQQQHLNKLPAAKYDSTVSKQRPIPQRLSYDSHDYPPPSYYQRPTYQHHYQQQQKQQEPEQEQQNQLSTYFQIPQRQDIGLNSISQPTEQFNVDYLTTASTISTPSTISNYANNFGNYLLTDANQQHPQYYPSQQHQQQLLQQQYPVNYKPSHSPGNYYPYQNHQQPQQQQRPPYSGYRPTAQRPSNYYEYQLGEIPPPRRPTPPPSPHNYPIYGEYHPTTQSPPGLASLASIFTTTQQYAPQFTNLLLGALTGGGNSGGGSTSTFNRPSQQQPLQQQRPINMQLIKALENIARNDDLQCVPKVLCQTIAGQTQRGQLPSFITSPAITNFLAGFPAASPALIYGRAALLGISGGERSCAQTYSKCPKNEYEILHYLNNHRGGFFKFFSEPEEQLQSTSSSTIGNGNYDDSNAAGGNDGVSSSLLNIFSALTGNPIRTQRPKTTTTTTQRPSTTLDVAGGIGNFFTQALSEYLSNVEYQRRRRRRRSADAIELETDIMDAQKTLEDEDFHDVEDDDDTDDGDDDNDDDEDEQYDNVEARILYRDEANKNSDYPKFIPQEQAEQLKTETLDEAIKTFNSERAEKKLKFPSGNADNRDPGGNWVRFKDNVEVADQKYEASITAEKGTTRRGKNLKFKVNDDYEALLYNHVEDIEGATTTQAYGQRIIFPDHYDQHIRKGRILNRPNYASSYDDYVRTTATDDNGDRFVLSSSHRMPHYQDYQNDGNSLSGFSTSSSHYYSQKDSQYSGSSSSISNDGSGSGYGNKSQETGFRPTPIPISSSNIGDSSPNNYNSKYNKYNYPNNNYVSNNRYSSTYQRYTTTTRRPRHEDDHNVYVTNGHGVTEYYITPDGRKVYL